MSQPAYFPGRHFGKVHFTWLLAELAATGEYTVMRIASDIVHDVVRQPDHIQLIVIIFAVFPLKCIGWQ